MTTDSSEAESVSVEGVSRILAEDIALGRLKPRERLIEDELVSRFSAKRHVVRRALAELTAMGIVVRPLNKGAMVKDFHPKEVKDLYTVRELLERKAAELLPLPASDELLNSLLAIHARHEEAVGKGDFRVVFRENLLFHSTLYAACDNPELAEAIARFADKTHSVRSYAIADPVLLNRATSEHSAIIKALRSGDRDALTTIVVEHLKPAMNAYLERTRYLHS